MRPIGLRGVSEGTGVAVLVVMTVVATASVGMTVTLLNDEGSNEYGAEFRFDYAEELKHLLIFYDEGNSLRAGNLVISGPQGDVTWAQIEGTEPNATVEPSNVPARLTPGNAYGSEVNEEDYVEIRYYPEGERDEDAEDPFAEAEGRLLASWNEPDEEGEGPVEVPEE